MSEPGMHKRTTQEALWRTWEELVQLRPFRLAHERERASHWDSDVEQLRAVVERMVEGLMETLEEDEDGDE